MTLSRDEIQILYNRYGHIIYHRCRRLLYDDQEAYDVTQEVFVRLLKSQELLRGDASPQTWLYRVSTNLCLNRIRDQKSRAKKLASPQLSASPVPGMARSAEPDLETVNFVLSLLGRVDEETRSVIIFHFVDEMTLEEISSVLDLSIPTLRKRIATFQGVAQKVLAQSSHSVSLAFVALMLGSTILAESGRFL